MHAGTLTMAAISVAGPMKVTGARLDDSRLHVEEIGTGSVPPQVIEQKAA